MSIICFVLEGASVESHRFVLLFPPHTGHGGEGLLFFVLVLVLQGAGSWYLLCCVELCQKQAQERMEVVGHCFVLWGQG